MNINGREFRIGFWHPFGPHGKETPHQIIARKRTEINANGWTLWSFQVRNTLGEWYREIEKIAVDSVFVFCSEGRGAKAPAGNCKLCSYYIPVNEPVKRSIPTGIQIPHHLGSKTRGAAFIVKDVIYPVDFSVERIEWLRARDMQWQLKDRYLTRKGVYREGYPTLPEYLIRPGNGPVMRKYRAILELKAPYLAEIGV